MQLRSMSVRVDSGPKVRGSLSISREFETVFSNSGSPDLNWEYVDSGGHFHAYTSDGKLPTLRRREEHQDCNGMCGGVCEGEGYTITKHSCLLCNEDVTPGWVAGEYSVNIPGPISWEVEAEVYVDPLREVSLRIDIESRRFFGIAVAKDTCINGYFGETYAITTFTGIGPLGEKAI